MRDDDRQMRRVGATLLAISGLSWLALGALVILFK